MPPDLDAVGLREGEPVRWRRHDSGHWQAGTVIGRERDGSVAVRDADGAWRSIVADRLEARRPNRRGRLVWQPIDDAPAQLTFFDPAPPPDPRDPRSRRRPVRSR